MAGSSGACSGCCAAVLCLLLASRLGVQGQAPPTPQSKAPKNDGFVRIVNGEFVIGCDTFYPAIWNQWEVIESGAGAPSLFGASLPPGVTGPQLIRSLMEQAPAAGLTVVRAWASSVDAEYALQTAPGVYNENVFRGLDYALDEASQHNLKVILVLIDHWQQGVANYVKWANDPTVTMNDFYNNTLMMGWYEDWLKTITSRVNTINGRRYSEDPTIMAWNLINEPRCQNCKPNQIAEWVGAMATHLKTLDKNHLITVGEDGFYSTTVERQASNPVYQPRGTAWAHNEGQDFIADHSSPDIDFASFHMWPDNWQCVREDFVRDWIRVHADDARKVLNKPALLEEFGKWANVSMQERNQYIGYALDETNAQVTAKTAVKGAGFWEWFDIGQIAPASEGGGAGSYGITTKDTTWAIISKGMNALSANNVGKQEGCQPLEPAAVERKSCESTLVRGLPGTGYEGPACDLDINECVRGTSNCATNASCLNSPGGFECKCWAGFKGDGTACEPTPQLDLLEQSYSQDEYQGPLICDIPYPKAAPGSIDDPTGSTTKANLTQGDIPGVGNPTPVKTLIGCLIACETAPGCSVAVYSPQSFKCLLKGCPSKYSVACSEVPTQGPGARDGPPLPPPAPPAPPPPPCTLPPEKCTENATFTSYYSKYRYNADCTQWIGNPGISVAPAPSAHRLVTTLPPDIAGNVSTASVLGPSAAASGPSAAASGPSAATGITASKLGAAATPPKAPATNKAAASPPAATTSTLVPKASPFSDIAAQDLTRLTGRR